MNVTQSLIAACAAMVLLTVVVGARMLRVRIVEMKRKRIHPQAVAQSAQRLEKLEDTRASDNFNHLFETPVLFYALCAVAIGAGNPPAWLAFTGWLYVALRGIHSLIQCTYNRVMHRFYVFVVSFLLLAGMWTGYATWIIGQF